MRVLIIEEDKPLGDFLAQALEAEHYDVEVRRHPDINGRLPSGIGLVLLDLSLAAEQVTAVIDSIRTVTPSTLIMVVGGRRRSEDVARFLDAGADDYVSKPFAWAELSARIRALRRRTRIRSDAVLEIGDLKLDRMQRQVERGGKPIDLTIKEFSLLEYLMRNAGRLITRAAILEHVWKSLPSPGSTNVVDVYIAYGLRVIEVLRSEQGKS